MISDELLKKTYETFKQKVKKISVDRLVTFEEYWAPFLHLLAELVGHPIPASERGEVFWRLMCLRKDGEVSIYKIATP